MGTSPLRDFRDRLPGLSADELLLIVDQARLVLEQNYVHLIDKRRRTRTDPVAECERLRARVSARWGSSPEAELVFHEELLAIFRAIRDRHTRYLLPAPLATATAFLPFAVDLATDQSSDIVLVSEVLPSLDAAPSFAPGVQITHWNGVSIDRVLGLGWARERGGGSVGFSPRELTVRPLRTHAPPAEDWVIVGYVDGSGRAVEARFEWQVSTPDAAPPPDVSGRDGAAARDPHASAAEASAASIGLHWSPQDVGGNRASSEARVIVTSSGARGCLSVPSFVTPSPVDFLRGIQSLVAQLPADGLIVDVRGNTGGNLPAAAGLAQMLSTDPVPLVLAQMRTTPTNLKVCRAFVEAFDDSDLRRTVLDLDVALETETEFTPLRPLGRRIVEDVGEPYPGPVAVVFDGFSYSATDVFAALIQDHGIGPTLSTTGGPTGGGGANVWTHDLLCELAALYGRANLGYEPLPRQASFTVSMRRLYRSADRSGAVVPIEDTGVVPDRGHRPTRADVLNASEHMLDAAALLLVRE